MVWIYSMSLFSKKIIVDKDKKKFRILRLTNLKNMRRIKWFGGKKKRLYCVELLLAVTFLANFIFNVSKQIQWFPIIYRE